MPLPAPPCLARIRTSSTPAASPGTILQFTLHTAYELAVMAVAPLRLIYVLATQGYGLKLEAPFVDASEIVSDAERLGLVLDKGTIAHYLNEARQQAESPSSTDEPSAQFCAKPGWFAFEQKLIPNVWWMAAFQHLTKHPISIVTTLVCALGILVVDPGENDYFARRVVTEK